MAQPASLLLIDDDQDLRDSLGDALEGLDFKVTYAANGQEALERLSTEELPDVILLDLLMPVMNGWQFCDERKKHTRLVGIPIIAMSAAVSKNPWSPYYLDVDDYIAKPIDLDDLMAKISACAQHRVEARRARR